MSTSRGIEQTDVDDIASVSRETDTDALQQRMMPVISLEVSLSSSRLVDKISASTSSNRTSCRSAMPHMDMDRQTESSSMRQNRHRSVITTLMRRNLPRTLHTQQLLK